MLIVPLAEALAHWHESLFSADKIYCSKRGSQSAFPKLITLHCQNPPPHPFKINSVSF